MNIPHSNFNSLNVKSFFSFGINTFLSNKVSNIIEGIVELYISLFVTDLKLSFLKDDLDDLFFGFVGEEFL